MKIAVLVLALLLAPLTAHAAKAVAVVTGASNSQTIVYVSVQVSEDTGTVLISTSFLVNFASSVNQINTDIKQKVRDELICYGITGITVNDIVLFGGPS